MYLRTGSCILCGECCFEAWPVKWPESFSHRTVEDLERFDCFSVALLCGIVTKENGMAGCKKPYGKVVLKMGLLRRRTFYYVWVPGEGLCTDMSPKHDGSAYSKACPFLLPANNEGERHCGLIGTAEEHRFESACRPAPLHRMNIQQVEYWNNLYPGCSYVYEEE